MYIEYNNIHMSVIGTNDKFRNGKNIFDHPNIEKNLKISVFGYTN